MLVQVPALHPKSYPVGFTWVFLLLPVWPRTLAELIFFPSHLSHHLKMFCNKELFLSKYPKQNLTHTHTHTHTLIDTTEHTYWHNWACASVLISSISLTEIHVHWCLLSPWPEPHLLLDTQTPFPVSGAWALENHKLVRYSATYWMPWRDQPLGWFMARNGCAPCREDSLEKATHSSILAWRIPWTEEPGRL